jgi:hypothetical protein
MENVLKILIVILVFILFYNICETFSQEIPKCQKYCFQRKLESDCLNKKTTCIDKNGDSITSECKWNSYKKNCYF